jgi:hypothetical protein
MIKEVMIRTHYHSIKAALLLALQTNHTDNIDATFIVRSQARFLRPARQRLNSFTFMDTTASERFEDGKRSLSRRLYLRLPIIYLETLNHIKEVAWPPSGFSVCIPSMLHGLASFSLFLP